DDGTDRRHTGPPVHTGTPICTAVRPKMPCCAALGRGPDETGAAGAALVRVGHLFAGWMAVMNSQPPAFCSLSEEERGTTGCYTVGRKRDGRTGTHTAKLDQGRQARGHKR